MVALCTAERLIKDEQYFKDCVKRHNKEYKDSKEESASIVFHHKKYLDDKLHDSCKKTFRTKLNTFSDSSDKEFIKHYTAYDLKTGNDSSRPSRAAKNYKMFEASQSADFRNQTGSVLNQSLLEIFHLKINFDYHSTLFFLQSTVNHVGLFQRNRLQLPSSGEAVLTVKTPKLDFFTSRAMH